MMATDTKRSLKEWFNNPYNALLILILIVSFALRFFLYLKTQGQVLWWDESEYMSAAKSWAFGVPYEYNAQRPPLFQAISALAFMLGLGEGFIKFAFVLLPSLAMVVATFYLGKELYNERVGIIAAALMAVNWSVLFWTSRVQPDFFSMTFQILAILLMWRSWKTEQVKPALWAGIFAALGFYFKVSALLVPASLFVFILIRDRLAGLKHKNHWYFLGGFIAAMIPYMIWSKATFGDLFAFRKNYSIAFTEEVARPFAWYNPQFLFILTEGILFIALIAGLVYALRFMLYMDVIVKDRKTALHADLLGIITMVLVSAFYIFYIRGTEDRWVFLWLPFMFMFIGSLFDKAYESLKKYNKFIVGAAIVLIICISAFQHITHATGLANEKVSSYMPVKEAGLWLKENTPADSKVFTISYTQIVYYSERNVTTYSRLPPLQNVTEMDAFVAAHKPDYIMWSVFEQHPAWTVDWIAANENKILTPVFWRVDSQNRPLAIIYEISQ